MLLTLTSPAQLCFDNFMSMLVVVLLVYSHTELLFHFLFPIFGSATSYSNVDSFAGKPKSSTVNVQVIEAQSSSLCR